MMKMTSAYANKVLRKLREDKEYWLDKELEGCFYSAFANEEPVIPEYDYSAVAENIAKIDSQMVKIKHAINLNNASNKILVLDEEMTIDEILVCMAQLTARKNILDNLRKQDPKRRVSSTIYSSRNAVPEYKYINYDLELIKKEYERIDAKLAAMQIALDRYNQTFEFDVDL